MHRSKLRRFLTYRISTLMVFVAFLASLCAWFGYHARRAQREEIVVGDIFRDNCMSRNTTPSIAVLYDYEYDHKQWNRANGFNQWKWDPPAPMWLRRIFGNNLFASVTSIGALPREFASVLAFDRLQELRCDGDEVTDDDIAKLIGFRELEYFSILHGRRITDDGITYLARVDTLENIRLGGCDSITADGLIPLLHLPKLRRLVLLRTPLDDSAVPVLSRFAKLKEFAVIKSKISPDGQRRLRVAAPAVDMGE